MQVSKIMLAVAALTLSAGAFAKPTADKIAIASGASATRGNQAVALGNLCTAAGGVMSTFGSGNIWTYVCADTAVTSGAAGTYKSKASSAFKNFAGTAFAEARVNVSGGSFSAVCLINNFQAGTACDVINGAGVPDKYFDPEAAAVANAPAGSVVVGGLMDVAADNWPSSVTAGLTIPTVGDSGVAQTFGVAVSGALYGKLFDAQKSSGSATLAKPIPSTCLVTDTAKLECVPSVGKAQMATIMANNYFNAAYTKGLGFLTGNSADDGVTIEYARRADTSGTQAAAQVYFLGTSCSSAALPVIDVSSVAINGSYQEPDTFIKVWNLSGTSNVRDQLKTSNYVIGVVSGENNQAESWRWVKVQGAAMGENAAPASSGITNRAGVKAGAYDFFFESKVVSSGNAGAADFWSAVTGALNTLALPVGLLNADDLSTYNKAGNACQNSSSN